MGEAAKPVLLSCCQLWKLPEVSYEMLVFLHPRVLSRVPGFPVASPCLWGKLENVSYLNVSKQVVMSFCVAGVAPCDIPTCLIMCQKKSKLEEVSYEMLVFLHPRVLSRLFFSCGVAVSMGEVGKHLLFECVQAGCHVVLRGRRGTLWHSNLFDNVSKISKLEEVSHKMLVFWHPRVLHSSLLTWDFTLHTPHFTLHSTLSTPHSSLYTLHSTLYTLHFTLHTPHSTLYCTLHTPHFILYTPHSTLHTLHSSLHTLHFTLHAFHFTLLTPHSTLHTLHSSLLTLHFTLHTPHFTLHTPHSTLYCTLHTLYFTLLTSHSTLYTPHSTLYTPHFTLHTPHFALHTPHSTLHTLHFTLHTLHSTLYTLHSILHTLHFTLRILHFTHSTLPTPHFTLHTPYFTLHTLHFLLHTADWQQGKHVQDCSNKRLQKGIVRHCITMCFDIRTINIRVSIRVRGLHLVFTCGYGTDEYWSGPWMDEYIEFACVIAFEPIVRSGDWAQRGFPIDLV